MDGEQQPTDGGALDEVEVVDGLPVLADVRVLEPGRSRSTVPAVQTAIAAATGFIAGAATLALLRRYGLSRLAREAEGLADGLEPGGRSSQVWLRHGTTYVVSIRTVERARE